jgi:hypothetical protein
MRLFRIVIQPCTIYVAYETFILLQPTYTAKSSIKKPALPSTTDISILLSGHLSFLKLLLILKPSVVRKRTSFTMSSVSTVIAVGGDESA